MPDSVAADDDRITFKYNRQGETRETKDQNGTVHVLEFDKLGRTIHDRVTTLGGGVDGAVRRLSTAYEVRGMRETITSYDNAAVGSGSVVNEVRFAYNDFGQVTADYQAHGGTVNTSTTPKVQYGYADGSANTIRAATVTYPDGRVITSDYGAAGSEADALSRVGSLVDDDAGSTHLADYSYLGLGTFVEVDYTEPDVAYTLIGTAGGNDPDTGDIYRGLDRFGRVKDSYWYDSGASSDVDRIKYGYDRNSNRLWRENTVAAAAGKDLDELYDYDLIDRLASLERGELSSLKDEISNLDFAQDWGLDATGNWRGFRQDDDGSGWDLDQQRTSNSVNEITDITESLGPAWVTPAYDPAGNMTTVPKPADLTAGFTATYDAWNRLVKLVDGASTLAEYVFDGAKRRIIKKTYVAGVLDETRHCYFTEPSRWQIVEERVGTSTAADRQFVWGLRYVDDLILRDRDTTADSTLDERLYALQDANWNVTAILSASAVVQERYLYSAYGTPTVLTASFGPRSASNFEWNIRFAGYVFDIESGLHCVRNRFLSSQLQWLQRDPLGYTDGPNVYWYAIAKPVTGVDPSGSHLVVKAIIIVAIVLVIVLAAYTCWRIWNRKGSAKADGCGKFTFKGTTVEFRSLAGVSAAGGVKGPGYELTFDGSDCDCRTGNTKIVQAIKQGTGLVRYVAQFDVGPWGKQDNTVYPGYKETGFQGAGPNVIYDSPQNESNVSHITACGVCVEGPGKERILGCIDFDWHGAKFDAEVKNQLGHPLKFNVPYDAGQPGDTWQSAEVNCPNKDGTANKR